MQSSDEYWAPNYQVNIVPELAFDEPLDIVTRTAASPTSDTTLSPKGSIGKPTRRRSRASRKAPMTLLKADANDFRSLVQKFTGCRGPAPTFGNYKGPINLNFAEYNYSSSTEKSDHQGHRWGQECDKSDQNLFSFGTNNMAAGVTSVTNDHDHDNEFFVSTVNYDCTGREDTLSLDDFDMENLSIKELSGPGDYSALPGTGDDDFWGY